MHEKFKTTCCYCGVGCGIIVQKDRNGRLQIEGDKDHPVNKGMLCSKGMNLHYTVMDISDADALTITFRKPDGSEITVNANFATDGTDGIFRYASQSSHVPIYGHHITSPPCYM